MSTALSLAGGLGNRENLVEPPAQPVRGTTSIRSWLAAPRSSLPTGVLPVLRDGS